MDRIGFVAHFSEYYSRLCEDVKHDSAPFQPHPARFRAFWHFSRPEAFSRLEKADPCGIFITSFNSDGIRVNRVQIADCRATVSRMVRRVRSPLRSSSLRQTPELRPIRKTGKDHGQPDATGLPPGFAGGSSVTCSAPASRVNQQKGSQKSWSERNSKTTMYGSSSTTSS